LVLNLRVLLPAEDWTFNLYGGNAYRIFVWKLPVKPTLRRLRRWEDDFKMVHKDMVDGTSS
jgi:hypothetical protein